jgi:hypothetical protein
MNGTKVAVRATIVFTIVIVLVMSSSALNFAAGAVVAPVTSYTVGSAEASQPSRETEMLMLENWVKRFGATAIMGFICLLLLGGKFIHYNCCVRMSGGGPNGSGAGTGSGMGFVVIPPALLGGLLGLIVYIIISTFNSELAVDIRTGISSLRINLVNYLFAALTLGLTCTRANSSHITWRGIFTSCLHEGMPMIIYSQILIWGQSLCCLLVILAFRLATGKNADYSIYGTLVPLGLEAGDDVGIGIINKYRLSSVFERGVIEDAESLGLLMSLLFGIMIISREKAWTDWITAYAQGISTACLAFVASTNSSTSAAVPSYRQPPTTEKSFTSTSGTSGSPQSLMGSYFGTSTGRNSAALSGEHSPVRQEQAYHAQYSHVHSEAFQRHDSSAQMPFPTFEQFPAQQPQQVLQRTNSISRLNKLDHHGLQIGGNIGGAGGGASGGSGTSSIYGSHTNLAPLAVPNSNNMIGYTGDKGFYKRGHEKASLGAHLSFIAVSAFVSFGIAFVARICEISLGGLETQYLSGIRLFKLSMFTAFIAMHVILFRTKIRFERDWFMRICGLMLDMVVIGAVTTAAISFRSRHDHSSTSPGVASHNGIISNVATMLTTGQAQTETTHLTSVSEATVDSQSHHLLCTVIFVFVCFAWNSICLIFLAKHMFPNFWLKRAVVLSCDCMGHAYTGQSWELCGPHLLYFDLTVVFIDELQDYFLRELWIQQ